MSHSIDTENLLNYRWCDILMMMILTFFPINCYYAGMKARSQSMKNTKEDSVETFCSKVILRSKVSCLIWLLLYLCMMRWWGVQRETLSWFSCIILQRDGVGVPRMKKERRFLRLWLLFLFVRLLWRDLMAWCYQWPRMWRLQGIKTLSKAFIFMFSLFAK